MYFIFDHYLDYCKSVFTKTNLSLRLQAALRKFCLFVAISVWKPGIAAIRAVIFLAWVVNWHGSSADECNVWILHFVFTDSMSWKYDPNKSFHWKMSSEQASNSWHFCSDQQRKKALQKIAVSVVIKSKDWLAHFTWNHANYYYCYILFSNCWC